MLSQEEEQDSFIIMALALGFLFLLVLCHSGHGSNPSSSMGKRTVLCFLGGQTAQLHRRAEDSFIERWPLFVRIMPEEPSFCFSSVTRICPGFQSLDYWLPIEMIQLSVQIFITSTILQSRQCPNQAETDNKLKKTRKKIINKTSYFLSNSLNKSLNQKWKQKISPRKRRRKIRKLFYEKWIPFQQ